MSGFCDCFLVPERLQYTHVQPKTTHYTLLCFLRTVMSTHHNWFHAHLKETFRGEACLGGWGGQWWTILSLSLSMGLNGS